MNKKNKFNVGDLVQWFTGEIGIVAEIGMDYPDDGKRRSRYADIHWLDHPYGRIWLCYSSWDRAWVIAKNAKV